MSSPEPFEVTDSFATLSLITTDAAHEASDEQTTPRQTHLPAFSQSSEASAEERRPNSRESSHSGSDTEREEYTAKMPSGSSSSKHHSSSSSSKKHSSSSSSSKHRSKGDDWSDVTEPEERRRIQNRIAQRKFRRCSFCFPSLPPFAASIFPPGSYQCSCESWQSPGTHTNGGYFFQRQQRYLLRCTYISLQEHKLTRKQPFPQYR